MTTLTEKTREELEVILTEEMSKILGSGVTTNALASPRHMSFRDILANRHLYERLGTCFVALGALNGYTDQPRGFRLIE
jgi:hypothetical protein